MEQITEKRCSKCGKVKPVEEFYKNRSEKDGLVRWCKDCWKRRRNENKEKIAQSDKQYRENNKEKIAQRHKQYFQQNKEKISKRQKQYKENNKEKYRGYQKQHYKKNKEKYAERSKQYYQKNKVKINNIQYIFGTTPEELKPLVEKAIILRTVKRERRERVKKINEVMKNER